jgi:sulfite dehydrogenase
MERETVTKDPISTTVLGEDPLTVETRPGGLVSDPTPADVLYVRNNLGIPALGNEWTVELAGSSQPARLSPSDIFDRLPRHDLTMVLQCAGNGRSHLPEAVPGVQWDLGGMACVEWSGVRLADLVAAHGGPAGEFAYVTVLGGDADPDDPARVERSVPAQAALEEALVADRMNGEPIPLVHGGPVRFVMPGYFAVNSVKWVRRISFTDKESDAEIQRVRYRLVPPGEEPGMQHPPVWEMGPVSRILEVEPGPTAIEVNGVAFSGGDPVVSVEVTTDGEVWEEADLGPDRGRYAWRRFRATVSIGAEWVASRCHTETGAQPAQTTPNRDGYAIDGWRDLSVRVPV